ncbi:MAG: hypothetical protein HYY23_09865 [Verrucomicrobia bacterium]|nr:hypothetical protein [Verrucomicrobiota bacterium]
MRFTWALLTSVSLLLGCKNPNPNSPSPNKSSPKPTPTKRGKAPTQAAAPAGKFPQVTPILESKGIIKAVNPASGFVVIDFYLSQLPRVGQRMSLYRRGLKVAEVKISGPEMSRYIAADIVAGEAQVGDEARPD